MGALPVKAVMTEHSFLFGRRRWGGLAGTAGVCVRYRSKRLVAHDEYRRLKIPSLLSL